MRWKIAVVATLGAVLAAWVPVEAKVVVAEGSADAVGEEGYELALKAALRKAVERGAGMFLGSQTETKNYKVVYDIIVSQSPGFVTEYKVLEKSEVAGITRVKVQADVEPDLVKKRWLAVQVLLKRKGNPWTAVLVDESIDRRKSDNAIAKAIVEDELLKLGFRLKDMDRLDKIKKADLQAAAVEGDIKKVAAIGRDSGIEVILMGKASSNFSRAFDLYGVRVFEYVGSAQIRAVRADTGAVLVSKDIGAVKAQKPGKADAADAAIRKAAKKVADKAIDELAKAWIRDLNAGEVIQLVVNDVPFEKLEALEALLKDRKEVDAVFRRSFQKGRVVYDVLAMSSTKAFSTVLSKMEPLALEIVGTSQNRIEAKLKTD